jgi:hypothetical protein
VPEPVEEPERTPEEPAAPETPVVASDPVEKGPPSTASFEEAMAAPEPLDPSDGRAQLTDTQLTGPMKGVIAGCRVPSNARITIRTAVQNGRAIGVTVAVRIERPKPKRPPPKYLLKATMKADAKTIARVTTCVDRAVRTQSWPPSKRRDSFTTEF